MNFDELLKFAENFNHDVGDATNGAEALETARMFPDKIQEMQRIVQYFPRKAIQFARSIPGADIAALHDIILKTQDPDLVYSFSANVPGADNSLPGIYRILSKNPVYLYRFAKNVLNADYDKIIKSFLDLFKSNRDSKFLVWADQVRSIKEKTQAKSDFEYPQTEIFEDPIKEEEDDYSFVDQEEESIPGDEKVASLLLKLLSLS